MPFAVKLILSNSVIISCLLIGKKFPALSGLIATMPLTSLIVLTLLYSDNRGDSRLLTSFVQGVIWGIVPTVLFFVTTLLCLRRGLPFSVALAASIIVWLLAAIVHQYLLK
jgi:uncharacterized membrane protein (GlpM family)